MSTRVVFFFLFLSSLAHASHTDLPPWRLGVRSQIVTNDVEFKPMPPLTQSNNLTYRPAQSNYFGVILGYRWLASTIWFSVPADPEVRNVEGTSTYNDMGATLYFDKIGFEFHYNSYQGFLIDPSSSISASTLNGSKYFKLPDMKTEGMGLKVLIPFNPERFSMDAAFNHSAIQNESGGSWIWIGAARYQRVSNSSPIIPLEKQPNFGGDQLISHAYMANVSWGIGYGYMAVLGGFFASPFLGLGLGYQSTWWSSSIADTTHSSLTVNVHTKLGLGYNSRSFFITAEAMSDRFQQNTDSIEIGNSQALVTFSLGSRF
jgi:hypothetical protein